MTTTICRKEIVSNLLSYKFMTVMLLMLFLCSCSFFIMYRDFKLRQADYDLVRPKPGEPIAVQPPNPLSIIARGLDDSMTRSYKISPIGITVQGGERPNGELFAFFPTPDFLYVVKVVMSLVALLMGFDQISREREDGTLRMILSNGVSRAQVLVGKWLGNLLSLALPFVLISSLGFVLLQLDSGIRLTADLVIRFLLILGTALLYMAGFLSLAFLISALTRRAATSLVTALAAWGIIVFLLPNLSTLIARSFVETPSVQALSEKREQIWTREILLAITSSRAAATASSRNADPFASHFHEISREQDMLEESYRGKFKSLTRLALGLGRLSPSAVLVEAVTEAAGTGLEEADRLKWNVISYKNRILDAVIAGSDAPHDPIPAFDYRPRPIANVLGTAAAVDLGLLAFTAVALLVLAHLCFVRYDVR